MKKIVIVGGGIAGLAAAYELEKRRKTGEPLDWTLYEASGRLGGTVQTTRRDGFVLEGGPDAWVTEKPWAQELAVELDLRDSLLESNDAARKTYVLVNGVLQAMPAKMRMMVPQDLSTLEASPLFSASARAAYAEELGRAAELRAASPEADESVASFVLRHFGAEVLEKIGAPLLSGVFGGDVARLSVQAVMPAFVKMEREHGSLIAAVQSPATEPAGRPARATFTTLRDGLGSLVEALVATLPMERIRLNAPVISLKREGKLWCVRHGTQSGGKSKRHFQQVLLATPADATRHLLTSLDAEAARLIPAMASSAVLVAFAWGAEAAATFALPEGFGFLVPQRAGAGAEPELLACTFVDQKFAGRVPPGGRAMRVFYGGESCAGFAQTADEDVAAKALADLAKIVGPLPLPAMYKVSRWPRSLPQYEVGHLERMARLEELVRGLGGLTLLGNSYRGVGLPDLIRDARAAAAGLVSGDVA